MHNNITRKLSLLVLPLFLASLSGLHAAPVQAQDYMMPESTPPHIRRAVAAERPADQRARDVARRPAEVMTLAGLSEGDRIAEITAFGQYYSRLILGAIGAAGQLHMYDMPFLERFGAVEQGEAFASAHDNVDYQVLHYDEIAFPSDLDAVYNVLFYHDFGPQNVDTALFNRKVYDALRPGGKYLVIDHKANPGTGWDVAGSIHRIDPAIIVEEVTAAGFELIADSNLLANPEDPRTENVFSMRGETDRALLLFQKPY